jgi:hypothetical protein
VIPYLLVVLCEFPPTRIATVSLLLLMFKAWFFKFKTPRSPTPPLHYTDMRPHHSNLIGPTAERLKHRSTTAPLRSHRRRCGGAALRHGNQRLSPGIPHSSPHRKTSIAQREPTPPQPRRQTYCASPVIYLRRVWCDAGGGSRGDEAAGAAGALCGTRPRRARFEGRPRRGALGTDTHAQPRPT